MGLICTIVLVMPILDATSEIEMAQSPKAVFCSVLLGEETQIVSGNATDRNGDTPGGTGRVNRRVSAFPGKFRAPDPTPRKFRVVKPFGRH